MLVIFIVKNFLIDPQVFFLRYKTHFPLVRIKEKQNLQHVFTSDWYNLVYSSSLVMKHYSRVNFLRASKAQLRESS